MFFSILILQRTSNYPQSPQFIEELRHHEEANDLIRDFLTLIQKKMLVVGTKAGEIERATLENVAEELGMILKKHRTG